MNVYGTRRSLMKSRISSFYVMGSISAWIMFEKPERDGTGLVVKRADAPGARSAKVTRDDALDADLLRSPDEIALLADHPRDDAADDDVCACEGLLQALDAVVQVSGADLDTPRTEVGNRGLGEGRGAYDSRDALN